MPLGRNYRALCDQQRREMRGVGVSVVSLEEEEVMVLDDSDDEVQEIQEDVEEVEIVSLGSPVRRGRRRGDRESVQSARSPSPPVMELDQVRPKPIQNTVVQSIELQGNRCGTGP